MPRVILALIVIGLTIYALIDCLRSDSDDIRALPKLLWLLVIVVFPVAGPALWLTFGFEHEPRTPVRGILAPDDDPEFLRSLKNRNKPRKPPSGPEPV